MNPIQSDLIKVINEIKLTTKEEKEAIFERKKVKYFHEKNGAEFKRRYPDAEETVDILKQALKPTNQ